MLDINIDTAAIEKRLADMRAKIVHFKRVDIGAEMSEWQTEDLHRNRPFTMRSRARGAAKTKIRPHSLHEMMASARAQGRVRRYLKSLSRPRKRPRRTTPEIFLHWSTRPILRQELEVRLMQRYRVLLKEKLKWA